MTVFPWSRYLTLLSLTLAPLALHANFSFAISPPRFELAIKPGDRLRQTIEITNAAAQAATLLVRTADWELRQDEAVVFHDPLQPGSCRPWVAIERRELLVAPHQPYRFRFEVAPPADTPPTECRFAIMLEGKDSSFAGATGALPVGARVGVIVYVAIGDVQPELTVVAARAEMRNGQRVPVLDVRNTGTAHGRLDGFLSATDAKGQQVDVAPASSPILPGQTRTVPLTLTRRGDPNTQVRVEFPLTVKGRLEWGKGRSTELDQRIAQ